MKALILSEGNKDIGFGHIARCLSLYQVFKESGVVSRFLVNGDSSVKGFLKNEDYQVVDWLKNKEAIFSSVADTDIVVIDSYSADYNFYRTVSNLVRIPVYIGGNKRLRYPPGIVVKESLYAGGLRYPKKRNLIYLRGPKYSMLRKEFVDVPEKEIKEKVESIMIAFGSKGSVSLMLRVIESLNGKYPGLKKNVIVGNSFRNAKEAAVLKSRQTKLIYHPGAGGMKKAMLASDICISAGGQTLYELARVGVPTIGICFSKDQKRNLESWQKNGFIEYAGWFGDEDLLEKITFAISKLTAHKERIKRSKIGRIYIDGKGAKRVVKKIMSLRGGFDAN